MTTVAASRSVPKPVPQSQIQDARTYQIQQLRRRYSPTELELNNGTTSLTFRMKPSDPDFPFELDHLDVELKVPSSYPKASPTLTVRNSDMPRGFAINIERGWDRLVTERKGATLLSLTNALDKNLEAFLSEQKTETVKMTIFKDTRHLERTSATAPQPVTKQQPPPPPTTAAAAAARPLYRPEESFSREQITEAKARRAQETRQLESRMGRLPLYQRSSDGIVYTLPLEPKRRAELPVGLRALKSVQLIIPILYPLQHLRILLNDVESGDAEPVEELFAQKAAAQRDMSLMSHLNYLTQNMHVLANQAQREAAGRAASVIGPQDAAADREGEAAAHASSIDHVKSHVQVIPRPPEWSHGASKGESSGSDTEDSYDSDEGGGGAALGLAPQGSDSASGPGEMGGIAITFPQIELHGIELLEISVLNIGVKCLRCKAANEIGGIKANGGRITTSCRKCASELAAGFRGEMVHANSTRAGFIRLGGCTVTDLLPSTFVPTCAKCSTAASPGFVAVRGDATTNVCRECHGRFSFKLPDLRFQSYNAGGAAPGPTVGPRRRAEKLGLQAGEPLPGRGACEHYRKSYRWFRFSCCDKVYACDRCHDAADGGGGGDGHPHEWANRMICGWCSREQNYRVDSCGFCGRSVVGRRGTGYWEGGKGTRDQVLMRRNDRRKHRRLGGDSKKKE